MKAIPIADKIPELDVAVQAVIKAGDAVLDIYQKKDYRTSTKNDDSPVTDADLKSNKIIKEILSQHTKHQILSEEDADNASRLSKDTIWIVDPLDGTSDFIDRTGEFTVMISLVRDKEPVIGVIGWPTEETLFVAQKNRGAFRYSNKRWEKITVTQVSDISKCRAVGSRHHLSEREKLFIKRLSIGDFQSVGSSLKVGKISSGEAEVYLTTTDKIKEWDSAASHCIVSEAGGKMTDMLGRQITYNNKDVYHRDGILVTNGLLHDEIVREFQRLE